MRYHGQSRQSLYIRGLPRKVREYGIRPSVSISDDPTLDDLTFKPPRLPHPGPVLGSPIFRTEYDPVVVHHWPDPAAYEPSPNWFDGFHVAPMPQPRGRIEHVQHEAPEPVPSYNDSVLTAEMAQELINQMMQAAANARIGIDQMPDPTPSLNAEAVPAPQHITDGPAVPVESPPDPSPPEPTMSLDDIVAMHDTFLESPDIAYDMPSPNPEDPMQQAADLQHMLLMNPELLADPGMMPGYWPGPLAPM